MKSKRNETLNESLLAKREVISQSVKLLLDSARVKPGFFAADRVAFASSKSIQSSAFLSLTLPKKVCTSLSYL